MSKPTPSTSARRRQMSGVAREALRERAAKAVTGQHVDLESDLEEAKEVEWGQAALLIANAAIVEPKQEHLDDWKQVVVSMERPNVQREAFIKRFRAFQRGYAWEKEQSTSIEQALDAVREQLERTRQEFAQKIEALSRGFEKLSPLQALLGDDSKAEQSPELAWCDAHLDLIRSYAPAFLAVDVSKNEIVIAAKTQEEFVVRLRELSPEKLNALYRVHTSMFV